MPKNNVGWGQGAVKNTVGFGSGASNNTVGWGDIHFVTLGHDETNLMGLSQEVIDWGIRVVQDGGVVENPNYINEQYNKFKKFNPTLLNIPGGYGEGAAYSQLPTDGSGDLSWTRNAVKWRDNAEGNIEEVPINVPALDYSSGVQQWSVEPQRTNILLYSRYDGAPSTSWPVVFGTGTFNYTLETLDNEPALKQVVTASGRSPIQQGVSLSPFTTYTVSLKVDTSVSEVLSGSSIILSAANFSGATGDLNASLDDVDADGYLSITFTTDADATGAIRIGLGAGGNVTGTLKHAMPQLEEGAYATSYIPTTSSQVTRSADTASVSNLVSNGILGLSESTVYLELYANEAVRDSSSLFYQLGAGGGRIFIYNSGASNSRPQVFIQDGIGSEFFTLTQDFNKIAITTTANSMDLFVNGIHVLSRANAFAYASETLSISGVNRSAWLGVEWMKNQAITIQEAKDITT